MTQQVVPEAQPPARSRARMVAGLIRMAIFLATHRGAPLPGGEFGLIATIRVPGEARGEKLANLEQIADRLGTRETADREGTHFATRCFGPAVTLAAHVSPEGSAHIGTRIGAPGQHAEAAA